MEQGRATGEYWNNYNRTTIKKIVNDIKKIGKKAGEARAGDMSLNTTLRFRGVCLFDMCVWGDHFRGGTGGQGCSLFPQLLIGHK